MEQFVGLVGILAIVADGVFEPTDMIEGMVADAVSGCHHLLIEFRMFAHVVAHHEESGLHPLFLQHFQDKRSGFGNRAIIEGEVDGFLMFVHAPQGSGVKPA